MKLVPVVPTEIQVKVLYKQLKERTYHISHMIMPTFEKHREFVMNNPYRAWFIIKDDDFVIGNVYIHFDNSIGLNCLDKITETQIKNILTLISNVLSPLEAKDSVRYKNFFLNVSASNTSLQKKLTNIGLLETQRTFVLENL